MSEYITPKRQESNKASPLFLVLRQEPQAKASTEVTAMPGKLFREAFSQHPMGKN